jgi:hypothetical protein
MTRKKAPERTVTLPDGTELRVEEPMGRVQIVDGVASVCELGLALRLGLQERPLSREVAARYFPIFELTTGEERPRPGEMLGSWPVFAWISQHEAAKVIGLTTRQVANLEVKGLPSVGRGKSKRYALPHLCIWYGAYTGRHKPEVVPWEVAEALHQVEQAEARLGDIVDRHGGAR